ncbi:MAG: hypothetical protein Q8J68_14535 [Methanolobus sp.]|uniref:hypothetical protein n=1 Tax=Methanolobus sp. TaxID=1874737 RepID=UPI002730A04D|nr:hypothetical protein [Methanolobus sp.]MDP2218491.1 hypothetical protein [Methanolobus sp.]
MEKQPSSIIIYKRGGGYYADVTGHFGGGYSGAHAGDTPEEAALFALREEGRYIKTNPLGGTMHAPEEIRKAIETTRI